eukprot:5115174-Lingulodinium_polyedra.AAC.1
MGRQDLRAVPGVGGIAEDCQGRADQETQRDAVPVAPGVRVGGRATPPRRGRCVVGHIRGAPADRETH